MQSTIIKKNRLGFDKYYILIMLHPTKNYFGNAKYYHQSIIEYMMIIKLQFVKPLSN